MRLDIKKRKLQPKRIDTKIVKSIEKIPTMGFARLILVRVDSQMSLLMEITARWFFISPFPRLTV